MPSTNMTTMEVSSNADARQRFADKLMATLNSAGLAMMISIGHRTRLFDTMSRMEPSTSARIAAEAGLMSATLREWLVRW